MGIYSPTRSFLLENEINCRSYFGKTFELVFVIPSYFYIQMGYQNQT